MATNLLTFQPAGVRVFAVPGHQRADPNRCKSSASASSSNWWAPLFGVSPDPDYIDSEEKAKAGTSAEREEKPARARFAPGCFTEKKARQLRLMTTEMSAFHDVMYHSAIASRLASDFKNRSDL